MMTYIFSLILKALSYSKYKEFTQNSFMLEKVQRKRLEGIFSFLNKESVDYDVFISKYKITSFDDWRELIEEQMLTKKTLICPECDRYQPTSGSQGKRKFIPYSSKLLEEFNNASAAWIYDIYSKFPKSLGGKQYWSLSWLPNEDRESIGVVDDSELFSFWKKLLIGQIFCVPKEVSFTSTSEKSLRATAVFLLANSNLRLISIWSPSFLVNLLELIIDFKLEISRILETGNWNSDFVSMKQIKAPQNKKVASYLKNLTRLNQNEILKKIWPSLALISCWDTALAKNSANKLSSIFPHVPIQGKGLWATEAVVTIPFNLQYVLAYQSHFYEFECLETGNVFASWNLTKGMKLYPIVTTGSGLIRYKMNDIIEVSGFYNSIPAFTFLGRFGHVDMVGEKLDHISISSLLENLTLKYEVKALTLLACQIEPKPFYILLVESQDNKNIDIDSYLVEYFHYRLARELGQLAPAKVFYHSSVEEIYMKLKEASGIVRGNIKLEAITLVESNELLNRVGIKF